MTSKPINQEVSMATAAPVSSVATDASSAAAAGDKMMAKSMSPLSQAAAALQSMMPSKSMYATPSAVPCDAYRTRNGVMHLKGDLDNSLMSAGGMYITKVAQNAQTYGAPSCGASKSSCGSISALMAKMKDTDIASLSPSDRNAMNTFSALSISRLSKAKENKDQAEAVSTTMDAATTTETAPKVGQMMDSLAKKSNDEASDIVASETVVKRDFLGRPCAPGTYNADMYRESYKKMMTAGMDLSMNNATPALVPVPVFASLRDASAMNKTETGMPASAPAAVTEAPLVSVVSGVESNMARVSESAAVAATAAAPVAASTVASTDNAGSTPLAYVQSLSWPWIIGIIGLSLLAILLIAGLVYLFIGSKKKPQGVVERTVAATGNTIGRGVDAVKSTVSGLLGAGERALSSVAEGTVNAGEAAFNTVKDTAGATLAAGATALGTVGATGGKLLSGDLAGAGRELVDGAKETVKDTLDIAKTAGSGLATTAGSVIDSASNVAGAAVDAGAAAIGGVADLATGTLQGGVEVAKAMTNTDASSSAEPSAEPSPEVSTEASEDQSIGVDDINQAFETKEKPLDATEDLKARTDEIVQGAADILNETSDASADIKDAVDQVASVMKDQ